MTITVKVSLQDQKNYLMYSKPNFLDLNHQNLNDQAKEQANNQKNNY